MTDYILIKNLRKDLRKRQAQARVIWFIELASCLLVGSVLGYLFAGGY